LRILNKHRVKYLIIGAYAVVYYTEPRYTKDLDIWIESSLENAKRVYKALSEFGAPLEGIKIEDFTNPKLVYQIGVEPVRVDILMGAGNLKFDIAWKRRKRVVFSENLKVNLIGLEDLIKLKEKANRYMDKRDSEELKYVKRKKLKK